MNLLESLQIVYDASAQAPETKKLVRARERVAKKIEHLTKQRERRKPGGELIATVFHVPPPQFPRN